MLDLRFARNLLAISIFAVAASNIDAEAGGENACPASPYKGQPTKLGDAVVFATPGLAVDADGAPNSYLVDGKGLSDTCDGVVAVVDGKRVNHKSDPGHWYSICQKAWAEAQTSGDYSHVAIFGFLADKRGPVLQSAGDPLPGKAYVTTTTMEVPGTPDRTQRHWVDATKIAYVVLTPAFVHAYRVRPGDLAVVYRPKTGTVAYAVFADGGGLGEASVKLHRDLGNDPVTISHGVLRANRGLDEAVLTVIFPGTNIPGDVDSDAWSSAIGRKGKEKLDGWGGVERLKSCAGVYQPNSRPAAHKALPANAH